MALRIFGTTPAVSTSHQVQSYLKPSTPCGYGIKMLRSAMPTYAMFPRLQMVWTSRSNFAQVDGLLVGGRCRNSLLRNVSTSITDPGPLLGQGRRSTK